MSAAHTTPTITADLLMISLGFGPDPATDSAEAHGTGKFRRVYDPPNHSQSPPNPPNTPNVADGEPAYSPIAAAGRSTAGFVSSRAQRHLRSGSPLEGGG